MDRPEELNSRILERNNISNNFNIRFTPRSVSTKYSLPESITNINSFSSNFKIGDNYDYADKINHESTLRNQIYPLQNNLETHYIPDKTSNLYNNEINNKNNNEINNGQQLFPNLFENTIFSNIENNINNLENIRDNNLFNNDTRQQLKNS